MLIDVNKYLSSSQVIKTVDCLKVRQCLS